MTTYKKYLFCINFQERAKNLISYGVFWQRLHDSPTTDTWVMWYARNLANGAGFCCPNAGRKMPQLCCWWKREEQIHKDGVHETQVLKRKESRSTIKRRSFCFTSLNTVPPAHMACNLRGHASFQGLR